MRTLPASGQLMLPLLDLLAEQGPMHARDACNELAVGLDIHPDIRSAFGRERNGRTFKLFDRRVRWVRQTALGRGLLETPRRGLWKLTPAGQEIASTRLAGDGGHWGSPRRGTMITLFTTPLGRFVWGHAEDVVTMIDNGSLSLLFTSPPYPLLNPKPYGNLSGEDYLKWMEDLVGLHVSKLAPHGAMLINLGEAYNRNGNSEMSTYREELTLRLKNSHGLGLFGKYYWHNPCKPPAGYWVTHAKSRPTQTVEEVLWLAPRGQSPQYFGNENRRPYSAAMKRILRRGGEQRPARPSGHGTSRIGFSVDHGGSWPEHFLSIPNADPNDPYLKFCREQGLPTHPARFPSSLADALLRTHSAPGQLVCDPFGGSATTAAVAEKLGRRWIACDRELGYGLGAVGRFSNNPKVPF